ncbi:MAG TPA: ribonuclease III [Candidatus Methylomirabilis sp.]|nr:ribonuclease III [Candidatus Methylomirabilis sp.]
MDQGDEEHLQERLGYRFQRPELLERALTHSSAVPELRAQHGQESQETPDSVEDNERLEFLGDAVLELLTREYLLESFPDWSEGQLSKCRARLVNARSLHEAARRVNLGEHLRLGRGEEKTGGREKPAILADAFEAVVAAVYLESGLGATRELLKRLLFEQAIEEGGEGIAESDRKSALQEFLQGQGKPPAEYRLTRETGPDHQKTFEVEVWIGGECFAQGEGSTKKEAERQAAEAALGILANLGHAVEGKG